MRIQPISQSYNSTTYRGKEQTVSQHIRQHLFEGLQLYKDANVYKGRMPEEYMSCYIEQLVPPVMRKKLTDDELLSLTNYNIYKIEGTKNSYRGPQQYQDLELLRNAGVNKIIYSDSILRKSTLEEQAAEIVEMVKALQNDSAYVCCHYGTNDTNIALYLNYFLNPSMYNNFKYHGVPQFFGIAGFENLYELYDIFTQQQKMDMGWTGEFEKQSRKKVEELREYMLQ